jgi:hypothetical protein
MGGRGCNCNCRYRLPTCDLDSTRNANSAASSHTKGDTGIRGNHPQKCGIIGTKAEVRHSSFEAVAERRPPRVT